MNLSLYRMLLSLTLIYCLCSCGSSNRLSRDYLYFQYDRDKLAAVELKDPVIQVNDILSIQVINNGLDQKDASLFNLLGDKGYTVGSDGRIEMPVIGMVRAAGLTRYQLQRDLKQKIAAYVKEPSVQVKFQNFTINVMGEVSSPGTKTFPTEKVTIIDAINAAGDLTPAGQREGVTIIREEANGTKKLYQIDLRSIMLFNSPVYQLQQNDIVYVNANKQKLKSLDSKKDPIQLIQIGLGFVGVLTTLSFLFRKN